MRGCSRSKPSVKSRQNPRVINTGLKTLTPLCSFSPSVRLPWLNWTLSMRTVSLRRALIYTLRLISVLTSYFALPHLKCLGHWVAQKGYEMFSKKKNEKNFRQEIQQCKKRGRFSQPVQPKVDSWCKMMNVCVWLNSLWSKEVWKLDPLISKFNSTTCATLYLCYLLENLVVSIYMSNILRISVKNIDLVLGYGLSPSLSPTKIMFSSLSELFHMFIC